MPYMGRGGLSSFGSERLNPDGNSAQTEKRDYRGGRIMWYYYIPLDNTYFLFQMIITFIILIVAGITYIAMYKSSIIDPIEDTKNNVINIHMAIIIFLLAVTIIANFVSKNKRALITKLLIVLAIAIITVIIFSGVKIILNSTYTNSRFEQIYDEEHKTENVSSNSKKMIDLEFTGVYLKSEKKFYVDECMKLYNIFNIKTYGILGLNILLIALLIFQISKISTIEDKKDRVSIDDKILFDEEENIKI